MNNITWCKSKKEGLKIVEPNDNLVKAYILKAEEALESMIINKFKDWKISTAYYTMYFSIYAILSKIGIKSEIHKCTLEFIENFLDEYFSKEDIKFIKNSMKARIDSQYYMDRIVPDDQYEKMLKEAPRILVICKEIILNLNEQKIELIREKFIQYN